MNITNHQTVLAALEARANRSSGCNKLSSFDDKLLSSALDETGTVAVDILCDDSDDSVSELQQEIKNINEFSITDERLKIHGLLPSKKGEGTIRLIYENANGINNRLSNNDKVEKAREIHDDLEVDVVAYNEHRLNMKHKSNVNGFNQLFRGGESTIQSVVAHNVHENISKVQEGGTCLMMFGPLTSSLDHGAEKKDPSGLGRWSVMTVQGEGFKTRIVCGYNPCYNKNPNSSTTYQQHRRYLINKKKDLTCPRTKFRDDLIDQLSKWREAGDKLIVCLDANENIYSKSIGKALTNLEGLAMKEVVGTFTGRRVGPTYFRGSTPIDGIWATSDISISNACIMPTGYGIGDHRLFIIDFNTTDIIGFNPPTVVRPTARRLITKLPGVATKYIDALKKQIHIHRLIERAGHLERSNVSEERYIAGLIRLDEELTQYMRYAEKKCRKIKSGRIPFSPEASMWIKRTQVYRSLLKYHAGKIRNRGNLKRSARRCGIENALSIPPIVLFERIKYCVEKCDYFRKHGKAYRRKHLNNRLQMAKDKEDDEAEKQILAIITREKEKCKWNRIKYVLGKQRAGACFKVQIELEDGTMKEVSSQEEVQQAIWDNVHMKRFYLAEEAPICNGELRGMFGYNATTITARRILRGTFVYPPEFDEATKEILQECAAIRLLVPKDSVSTTITLEDWVAHWSKAREETSSSISGRHFSHYIAGLGSEHIAFLQSLFATLILKRGIVLERWSNGLSVMLEKIFGCSLITKLRSILLMEADFNATNKIIYGIRMLNNVRKYKLMPEEVFSERNRLADDGTLSKVLFYDIVRACRRPAGLASVDADNCYDRIAHPMLSMILQAFGVPANAVKSMLSTIQDMKFFLRTGYGDSKSYVGGHGDAESDHPKTQGIMQGNGGGPACWTVETIPMLRAHKRKGHGAHLLAKISGEDGHIAGSLFVDDDDKIHLNMKVLESTEQAFEGLQNSIINWGKLLIATGGALKPSKCSCYLISFKFKKDGTWIYEANESEWEMVVPLANGEEKAIEHLSVSTAIKTLGSMTCPSGDNTAALARMVSQAEEWHSRLLANWLSRRDVLFMVERQFWPRIGYGICNNTASWSELDKCLNLIYGEICRKGGIRKSACKLYRTLDRGFFGASLPHPGVECLVAQIIKLLTHFGCRSSLGLLMLVSFELMVIELGLSIQPFQTQYHKFQQWVTHSWLKSIWEKVSLFSVTIEVKPLPIQPPREGDGWFMQAIIDTQQFDEEEKAILNRFRCHQQVLFLSDIMDAGGSVVDKRYLKRRPINEQWSHLIFPIECPPNKHLQLWKQAVMATKRRLGKFKDKSFKIWDYRYDEDKMEILHLKGNVMDVYTKSLVPRYSTRSNCFTRSRINVTIESRGKICTIDRVAEAVIKVVSYSDIAPEKEDPHSFWEVVKSWGQTWLWDNMRISGDIDWLAEAIRDNSLVAVTDGSYIQERYPYLNSAAFIFECSVGRGRLMGSFIEYTPDACAYRGELLGLMAIHLILLGINDFHKGITGSVQIFSDCLGALEKVENLPPYRIPSRCSHGDILKNILVNCSNLTFARTFSHVKGHQDDHASYLDLDRPAQLNCQMDHQAKRLIWDWNPHSVGVTKRFPLEPICIMIGNNKVTANNCDSLRFWVNSKIARSIFHEKKILFAHQFDAVDWEMVHKALWEVPRMFSIWACKQVMSIAAANANKPWEMCCKLCPSCGVEKETCSHILVCKDAGRVETFFKSIDLLDHWLDEEDTDPELRMCITEYALGRGNTTMHDICIENDLDDTFLAMAREQDLIGWRRFMEGMICSGMRRIQANFAEVVVSNLTITRWASGCIIKLLEATHGQWLYRCVQTHDSVSGTLVTMRKEQLQIEIERQNDMGIGEDWEREDQFLAEVNLEDLESTSGANQEYWLLAIRTAREAARLRRIQQTTNPSWTNT